MVIPDQVLVGYGTGLLATVVLVLYSLLSVGDKNICAGGVIVVGVSTK